MSKDDAGQHLASVSSEEHKEQRIAPKAAAAFVGAFMEETGMTVTSNILLSAHENIVY